MNLACAKAPLYKIRPCLREGNRLVFTSVSLPYQVIQQPLCNSFCNPYALQVLACNTLHTEVLYDGLRSSSLRIYGIVKHEFGLRKGTFVQNYALSCFSLIWFLHHFTMLPRRNIQSTGGPHWLCNVILLHVLAQALISLRRMPYGSRNLPPDLRMGGNVLRHMER